MYLRCIILSIFPKRFPLNMFLRFLEHHIFILTFSENHNKKQPKTQQKAKSWNFHVASMGQMLFGGPPFSDERHDPSAGVRPVR